MDEKNRRKRRLKTALYFGGTSLGLILFTLQLLEGIKGVHEITNFPENFPIGIVTFLVLYAILSLIQVSTWQFILRSLDVKINFATIAKGYFLSFLPRYIPGTVWGYLARSEWLYRTNQVPYHKTNLASLVEAALQMLSATILSIELISKILGIQKLPYLVYGAIALVFLVAPWLIKVAKTKGYDQKYNQFFQDIHFGYWLIGFIAYLLYWVIAGLAFTLLSLPFNDGSFSISLWWQISLSYSMAWLGGFLAPFVPSGIGVREVLLKELLSLHLRVSPEGTVIVVIISRLLMTLVESIWVILGLVTTKKR